MFTPTRLFAMSPCPPALTSRLRGCRVGGCHIPADICRAFDDLADIDKDSVPKDYENCARISNIDQIDFQRAGDECDPDIDADGVLNQFDPCPFTALGVAVDASRALKTWVAIRKHRA